MQPGTGRADTCKMDELATALLAVRQADLQTRVDYAVARKMLDTQAAAGDAAVKLIEAAAKSQVQATEAFSGADGVGGVGGVGGRFDAVG